MGGGWRLRRNLISSNPQTWPYGSVFPVLYESLKIYGSGEISSYIHENDPIFDPSLRGKILIGHFTFNEEKLLDKIWTEYGHMDGYSLSAMTHKKGAPWDIVSKGGKIGYIDIHCEEIRTYYAKLLEQLS